MGYLLNVYKNMMYSHFLYKCCFCTSNRFMKKKIQVQESHPYLTKITVYKNEQGLFLSLFLLLSSVAY